MNHDRLEDPTMTSAPARNLLFGALLLVCAWVPAAKLAAPHPRAAAVTVEAPAEPTVRRARHAKPVVSAECASEVLIRWS